MDKTKVKLTEKLAYGIGAMSNEFQLTIIGTYLLLFMTDVMQIAPGIAGSVFLFGNICDAFSDIAITNLADKTKTRFGTYRPWMLAGIPLAVSFTLNFFYPGFLQTDLVKAIWVYAVYFVTVPVCQTAFICPYITMNSVMSEDAGARLDFATFRTLGENFADILVNALVMTIVLRFGSSYKDITGWRIMALFFAGLMILTTILGFLGVRERVPVMNEDENGDTISLATKLGLYKGNYAAIKMLIITVSFYFFFAFACIMFSYFCICNLGHEDWIASLSTISIVAQLITVVTLPYLGRRFPKRILIILGGMILMISSLMCCFMNSYTTALLYQILKGVGIGLIGSLIWSMWPEVTDYTTKVKGIAAPGIILAVGTFFMKVGTGFSSYISSQILNISGYDASLEIQSATTLAAIRYSYALIPLFCILVCMVANYLLKEISE